MFDVLLTLKRILRKLGGDIETEKVTIFPEATYNFELMPNDLYMAMVERTMELSNGQNYTVLWDGTTYNCTAITAENVGILGNMSIAGAGIDSGEPFAIQCEEGTIVLVAETAGEHTVSVSSTTETIHPIDQKYLPGVCLPVFNDVLDLGALEEIEDGMAIEVPTDLMAKLSTKPYAFMARCTTKDSDENVMNTTAIFVPFDIGGIAFGWNATVSFGNSSYLYTVAIGQMGDQYLCQVGINL